MKKKAKRPSQPTKDLLKGEARRLEIIEATLETLAKEGLFQTTFESIGRRVGIGKSHVVYYFPNLEDLIFHALTAAYVRGQDIVMEFMMCAEEGNPLDRYIDGAFYWIKKHPTHGSAAILLLYQSTLSARFRALQEKLRGEGLSRIQMMVAALKPRWSASKVKESAEMIHALVLGGLIYAGLPGTDAEFDRYSQHVKETCRTILS